MTQTEKKKLMKLVETRLIDIVVNCKIDDLQEAKETVIQEVIDLFESEMEERGYTS